MKNGGADVSVLNQVRQNGEEDWRGKILANARGIADSATDEMPLVGYLVVGFFSDGRNCTSFRYDDKRCPVPVSLLPSWMAEIVRREMVTVPECRDIFDEKFEWRDGA